MLQWFDGFGVVACSDAGQRAIDAQRCSCLSVRLRGCRGGGKRGAGLPCRPLRLFVSVAPQVRRAPPDFKRRALIRHCHGCGRCLCPAFVQACMPCGLICCGWLLVFCAFRKSLDCSNCTFDAVHVAQAHEPRHSFFKLINARAPCFSMLIHVWHPHRIDIVISSGQTR